MTSSAIGSTSATGIGGTSSAHGMTSSTAMPSSMSYSFMSSLGGVTSSTSSHALASTYDGILSGGVGLNTERTCLTSGGTAGLSAAMGNVTISTSNVSPLPMRAHQMNTMPPLCQVCSSVFMVFIVNVLYFFFENGFHVGELLFSFLYREHLLSM